MLEQILTKEECAACRLCCKFDSYGLWQTPVICQELASRILQEYAPQIKFVRRDEHFLMKMEKEPEADLYNCPLLDDEHGCIMGSDKPFDCEIFPFRVMNLNGTKVLTLSPECPVANKKCFDDVCTTALKVAPYAFSTADAHPELVKPYIDDHPILAVEKSKYGKALV